MLTKLIVYRHFATGSSVWRNRLSGSIEAEEKWGRNLNRHFRQWSVYFTVCASICAFWRLETKSCKKRKEVQRLVKKWLATIIQAYARCLFKCPSDILFIYLFTGFSFLMLHRDYSLRPFDSIWQVEYHVLFILWLVFSAPLFGRHLELN